MESNQGHREEQYIKRGPLKIQSSAAHGPTNDTHGSTTPPATNAHGHRATAARPATHNRARRSRSSALQTVPANPADQRADITAKLLPRTAHGQELLAGEYAAETITVVVRAFPPVLFRLRIILTDNIASSYLIRIYYN